MRLKTYTAETVADAMHMIRRDMGDEAIIVSTQDNIEGQGCRIVAAIEDRAPEVFAEETRPPADRDAINALLRQLLLAHGLPANLADRLLRSAAEFSDTDPATALAAALDIHARFLPLDVAAPNRPLVLVGMPGAGKTITAAKLAAHAKLAGRKLFVASTDAKRAGGIEQLSAFTRILDTELVAVAKPSALADHAEAIAAAEIAIIDTAGVNPFDDDEMATLGAICDIVQGEMILVQAAGADALESVDTAAAFHAIGARRMIVTRLDMTRRLGGIVAAAVGARLAIAAASINPNVADGLSRLNPVSLARLILPDEDEAPIRRKSKVMQ